MTITGRRSVRTGLLAACFALAACLPATQAPTPPAPAQPTALRPPSAAQPATQQPSAYSQSLAQRYARLEQHLQSQGLLRTDGGGPDTVFTDTDVLRNFERIAFYDEHTVSGARAANRPGALRKWTGPVRVSTSFGSTVPEAQRASDRAMVAGFTQRLARVTGHPISMSANAPNFHVFFMTADDTREAQALLRSVSPNVNSATLSLIANLPPSIYCLVTAFGSNDSRYSYSRAVAFVRAEQPELMRRSCVHEEMAQGMGLANDSPRARPSIFNDDDEFALLTTHDELLLGLLYDPALRPGMGIEEARPILRRLTARAMGNS